MSDMRRSERQLQFEVRPHIKYYLVCLESGITSRANAFTKSSNSISLFLSDCESYTNVPLTIMALSSSDRLVRIPHTSSFELSASKVNVILQIPIMLRTCVLKAQECDIDGDVNWKPTLTLLATFNFFGKSSVYIRYGYNVYWYLVYWYWFA